MKLTQRKIYLAIIAVILFIVATSAWLPMAWENRYFIIQNEHIQRFIPLYHSMRKIPDIVFFPQALTTKSNLERYEIYISDTQLQKMNSALETNAFSATLENENKIWVKAEFRAGDYVDTVDIRYRGELANHWNSYKKSYSIKFPKDNLFRGMREMRLIIPDDRAYFGESLNNYRARKMGQLVPQEYYVRLSVNGSDDGVMLASEHWSQAWIEKQPMSALSGLFGTADVIPPEFSMYSTQAIPLWKSWNVDSETFPQLEALISLVELSTDEEFRAIAPSLIDLESFYAQDTIHLLSGSYHASDDGNNIILLFDATEGRFKTIPYNAGITNLERFSEDKWLQNPLFPLLQRRIWGIPEFRKQRDDYLQQYVDNHYEDDLAYIDEWTELMTPEFYKDNAMLDNNFMYLSALDDYKEAATYYLDTASTSLMSNFPLATTSSSTLELPEGFNHLRLSGISQTEFLRQNPQFRYLSEDSVQLSGYVNLSSTIVIPRGTRLVVNPGTYINLAEDVSILSYSPVMIDGTENNPITITGDNWGSLAVANTEATSSLSFTTISGGSELTIGGVWFSGMIAFHNAPVDIYKTTFDNVLGEDGLNVKGAYMSMTESVISNTLSDAIDTDYVTDDSILENNFFQNIGGDAIDISWTNIEIANNTVDTCTDKGISVGERSQPTLNNNDISNCDLGIAVKDQSNAIIINNRIKHNRIGVTAYQKKEFFGGGTATLSGNTFEGNKLETKSDMQSVIEFVEE